MSTFFRTAFFFTNLPWAERLVRVGLGAGLALAPALRAEAGAAWWALAVSTGVGVALTGVVGFCPACYFAGRRLTERRSA